MEKLPVELLAKVFQNLPRYDLPSVRLISRTFAAEAAPFLFNTISLWIQLKSLEALTSISEHPRLSKYVKTIAFSPVRFIDGDRMICESQVRDNLKIQPGYLSSHEIHLGQHMAAYDSYIAGQRYLASESLDVKVLSQALSKLPKFKNLILDYQFRSRILIFRNFFGRGRLDRPHMVKMDGDYAFPVLFKALSNAKVAITALTIRDSYEGSFWSDDSSMQLPGFEVVYISPTASYGMVSKALAETFYPPHNLGCRAALRELRHFEVDLGNEDSYDNDLGDRTVDSDRKFANTIRYILKWSSQIESIRIPQTMLNSLWLMDLFPTEGLANLQKVHLWEFNTNLSDLLLFFQLHGRKLKDVRFTSVDLEDANWPTALHHLRSMEFADLEIFSLFDCSGRIRSHSLKNVENAREYITGATDFNPLS